MNFTTYLVDYFRNVYGSLFFFLVLFSLCTLFRFLKFCLCSACVNFTYKLSAYFRCFLMAAIRKKLVIVGDGACGKEKSFFFVGHIFNNWFEFVFLT